MFRCIHFPSRILSIVSILIGVSFVSSALAEVALQFNPRFLKTIPGQPNVDLSLFAHANRVLPGNYLVDVYVNNQQIGRIEIRFDEVTSENREAQQDGIQIKSEDITKAPAKTVTQASANAEPCLKKAMLAHWGINLTASALLNEATEESCIPLKQAIAHSDVRFDMNKQKLDISVPQIAMAKKLLGDISPALWDKGINAARINYQLIATHNAQNSKNSPTNFSGMLESGVNLNGWRLRHRSNYQSRNYHHHWQTLETYAKRDLPMWYSTLTLGDTFTPGAIFNSISVRGAQLGSDLSMMPYSEQGYAPVIRGMAQTNATVTIKQNGYVIYTALVAPGPFVIDDLAPTTAQGELEIIVAEADGRVITTRKPYSTPPMQLRAGRMRYNMALGQYRNQRNNFQPLLAQGTLTYGINDYLTVYTGIQAAFMYHAGVGGVGINLGNYGSLSLDTTYAYSNDKQGSNRQGQQLRVQYTKSYTPTQTYFQVSAYRYTSPSFRTFSESAERFDSPLSLNVIWSPRSRIGYTVSQQLASGNLSAQLQETHDWNGKKNQNAQISYQNRLKALSYGIYYTHQLRASDNAHQRVKEHQLSLSLSLPFDSFFDNHHSTFVSYYATSNLNGTLSQSLGASGSLTEDRLISYNVHLNQSNTQARSGTVGIQAQTPYANINVNQSHGRGYQATNASLAGGMVIHQQGITLSPPLSETIILIKAPDAEDITLDNHANIKTNAAGYAVLPYATPYRKNRVTLQTEDLKHDIEIKNSTTEVIPSKGAIVLAEYETRRGHKILLTVRDHAGKPLPFGARVEDRHGHEMGTVGMQGRIYLTGANPTDTLIVKQGKSASDQCTFTYALSPDELEKSKTNMLGLIKIKSTCFTD